MHLESSALVGGLAMTSWDRTNKNGDFTSKDRDLRNKHHQRYQHIGFLVGKSLGTYNQPFLMSRDIWWLS
jgi:hypothetical protein